MFDLAKQRGFRTAYFYAKTKLGYLVSAAVDEHALARDDGIDRTRAFFGQPGERFVFLHISGHERQHGTLHPEDFKLPLIMAASENLPPLAPGVFNITGLGHLVQRTLDAAEQ